MASTLTGLRRCRLSSIRVSERKVWLRGKPPNTAIPLVEVRIQLVQPPVGNGGKSPGAALPVDPVMLTRAGGPQSDEAKFVCAEQRMPSIK
ncbi:unnamed protein product [Protopolystoma xenopodis]|uniref:Uncharacterized protein n=1 Tax=Protopolystoma xenopodis TaxID=117903 RepID=A0A3S5AX00_9PLAT|nr:unnamed protein product [Protopolystoma xenopodis]